MRHNVFTHNYSGYSNGCRCGTCKDAKAGYMRERRATAYLEVAQSVPGITHGRFGYEERGCRCDVCVAARRLSQRRPEPRERAA